MALMTPQAISSVITPTFATPTAIDTITPDERLILYVKNGATSTTVTVIVPGNQVYTGGALPDLAATFSNGERAFYIPTFLADPSLGGLIAVSYTSTATVTVALLKV